MISRAMVRSFGSVQSKLRRMPVKNGRMIAPP